MGIDVDVIELAFTSEELERITAVFLDALDLRP